VNIVLRSHYRPVRNDVGNYSLSENGTSSICGTQSLVFFPHLNIAAYFGRKTNIVMPPTQQLKVKNNAFRFTVQDPVISE
jgi:hypothetical protein